MNHQLLNLAIMHLSFVLFIILFAYGITSILDLRGAQFAAIKAEMNKIRPMDPFERYGFLTDELFNRSNMTKFWCANWSKMSIPVNRGVV